MGAHPEGKNFWGAHRNPGGPVSAEEKKIPGEGFEHGGYPRLKFRKRKELPAAGVPARGVPPPPAQPEEEKRESPDCKCNAATR